MLVFFVYFSGTPKQVLKDVVVEYEVLAGWEEDISHCKDFDNLPVNAQVYVRRVEVRRLAIVCRCVAVKLIRVTI